MGKYDGLIRHADEAGDAVRKVIRAYHGSPHDFDRFDASKIGTGEGAQAYGHGLYFAGNEDVAESYREQLTPNALVPHTPEEKAELLWRYSAGKADAKGTVLQMLINDQNAFGIDNRAAIEYAKSLPSDFVPPPPSPPPRLGRVYEVEIGHPEDSLLDYDRPMGGEIASRLTPALRSGLERGVRERLEMGQLKRHADSLRQMIDDPSLAPGQLLLHGTAGDYGAASAARKLKDAGIPGLRYLDQGSRSAGEGTRNYVIFPGAEDSIRILRKYAIPGAVGTGVASQYEGER